MTKIRKIYRHSKVSRRNFMKMLGLGIGGIGAAGIGMSQAQPFKDLDEVKSHKLGKRKLPFWVKEVDKPTVEIDWDNLEHFPGTGHTLFNRFNPAIWPDPTEYDKIMKAQVENATKWVGEDKPGNQLKDYALMNASAYGWFDPVWDPPWTGPEMKKNFSPQHPILNYTPEDWNVPRYEGTPEENAQMMRVVCRLFGAADIGFLYIDDKIKKLLWRDEVGFVDGDEGYQAEAKGKDFFLAPRRYLPNKDLWIIAALIPQSLFQGQITDRGNWAGSNWFAYSRISAMTNRIMVFLKSLGYQCYGGSPTSTASLGSNVGFGVMAGLAEYARAGHMISPFFGNMFRTVLTVATDLPLAPTKPIDAGILEFCKTCKKCAKHCPAGAISMEDEPFWGGDDPWQRKGIKGFYAEARKCFTYIFSNSPDCGICQAVCPFSKADKASIHQIVKATIGTTPAFNKIFIKMDDVFGYGPKPMEEQPVWEMDTQDIPLYGLDSSRS